MSGLSQATIWHLEAALKGPTWATLYKLTQGLGVRRVDLGVMGDWPGPILDGLLGARRLKKGTGAPLAARDWAGFSCQASRVSLWPTRQPDRGAGGHRMGLYDKCLLLLRPVG